MERVPRGKNEVRRIWRGFDSSTGIVGHSTQRTTAHLLYEGTLDFPILYIEMRCGEYMRRGTPPAFVRERI